VVSSALESGVGLAAEIALAGSLPSCEFACGLGTGALLAADVVDPAVVRAGMIDVPRRPPVPTVDDALSADAGRTRWWHDRLARVRRP
jgi:O-succinylbenzoate synthase